MIFDKLENTALYSGISENLKKGLDFLKSTNLSALEVGRHEIDGKNVFALVSEYDSKLPQDCKLEGHHTYADIQYIISGHEAIGFAPINGQAVTIEYNSEKDIVFFAGETVQLTFDPSVFAVFFPQDLHRPCMQIDGAVKMKKLVIKIKI